MVLPGLHFLFDISCCNSSTSCILQSSGDQYGKENQKLKGDSSLDSSNWDECRWYCRTAITLTMIFALLAGSGILGVSGGGASAVSKLTPNNTIMVQSIPPIAADQLGTMLGGIILRCISATVFFTLLFAWRVVASAVLLVLAKLLLLPYFPLAVH
jgi:hypothetical protein